MADQFSSMQDYFNRIDEFFDASKAKGENFIFQYALAGDGGGDWYITMTDGSFTVTEGKHANPDTTIRTSADTQLKILNGQMKGHMAFLTGKIKIDGSKLIPPKLQKIFPVAGVK